MLFTSQGSVRRRDICERMKSERAFQLVGCVLVSLPATGLACRLQRSIVNPFCSVAANQKEPWTVRAFDTSEVHAGIPQDHQTGSGSNRNARVPTGSWSQGAVQTQERPSTQLELYLSMRRDATGRRTTQCILVVPGSYPCVQNVADRGVQQDKIGKAWGARSLWPCHSAENGVQNACKVHPESSGHRNPSQSKQGSCRAVEACLPMLRGKAPSTDLATSARHNLGC